MKLYHGTRIDCKDYIIENGLEPNITDKSSHISDENRCLSIGIFGFDNMDDAIRFANDLCDKSGIAIFSFEAKEVVVDPEFDGEAYFCPTEENIEAALELEYQY